MNWYLKNWEVDKDLPLAHDEYLVVVEGRNLKAECRVARQNFEESWIDEDREIVVGRKPKTTEAFHRIAVATDRDIEEMKWLDWARRNPMEAREVLDLPPKQRSFKGKDTGAPGEPSWWPQVYSDEGVEISNREYLVERNDDFGKEVFGYCSDQCAASAHFSHWEMRIDEECFHHVIARGPRTKIAKFLCHVADEDREKSFEGKEELLNDLEGRDLVERRDDGPRLTQNAVALMEALEEGGAFAPGEAQHALRTFVEGPQ